MTTDEELMLEFRQGSREAFEEIFQRHRDALYGFFRRRLHDASRAEDLAQETFLAVIRGVARYEPRALVRTYLYGIALNLLAAERRKRSRDGGSPGSVGQPPLDADPDAALWVRQAVERLDAGARNPDAAGVRAVELQRDWRACAHPCEHRTFKVVSWAHGPEEVVGRRQREASQRPEARNIARPLNDKEVNMYSTHPINKQEVMAYLDGELPVERAAAVAAHLQQCAECRSVAEDLRAVARQMLAWQVEPSPDRLTEGVTAALEITAKAEP